MGDIELNGPFKGFKKKMEDHWEFKVLQDMHLKNFYRAFYEWLDENDFYGMWKDDKVETFYDEKHKADGKRELRIRWRVFRDVDSQGNKFAGMKFEINWLILYMKNKQVVIDGAKKEIQNGEVEIKCRGYMLTNQTALKKSKWLSPFLYLFWNRWYKYQYESYKDKCKYWTKEIEEKVKSLLAMRTYSDRVEFHRKKGFEDPYKMSHPRS